jgi:hypothetical protein
LRVYEVVGGFVGEIKPKEEGNEGGVDVWVGCTGSLDVQAGDV